MHQQHTRQLFDQSGQRPNSRKTKNSGFLLKVYCNGDVYEGDFYRGKYFGSEVYYYKLNGRYEDDWADQKYDGYGIGTWSKGRRYRDYSGQCMMESGLRGSVMDVEFIHVKMEANMLVNSKEVSNTDLATTISED